MNATTPSPPTEDQQLVLQAHTLLILRLRMELHKFILAQNNPDLSKAYNNATLSEKSIISVLESIMLTHPRFLKPEELELMYRESNHVVGLFLQFSCVTRVTEEQFRMLLHIRQAAEVSNGHPEKFLLTPEAFQQEITRNILQTIDLLQVPHTGGVQ